MIQGKLKLADVSGRKFEAESGSGHRLVMDDSQGNAGARPIELALLALGGCTAFDVVNILRKKRQTVTHYEVELRADQNCEPPKVFTRVEVKHRFYGAVDPAAVRSAIHLSESKYCSVGAMIGKSAEIVHTFEINPQADITQIQETKDEPALHTSVRS